ncbi:IgGFc-binding protein [Polyangium sp. y55x31]|uniref:IgGFc-binding protein n=1 Tax=Polyangium sp. y55x31 TaxID=3042688 RepID=UPI0024823628|nr:IgGFc-binding protein [Polyangium sp. y55x31]MDI1480845.1 IgGFc-binding protein [Polyangium sp. y55x31]
MNTRVIASLSILSLSCAALAAACSAASERPGPDGSEGGASASNSSSSGQGGAGTGGVEFTVGSGGGGSCGSQCSADLHSVVDCNGVVQKTCPDDQACAPDLSCVPACEAATLAKSTVGCEYYSQTTVNWCFALYVVNTWTSPVTMAVEANGASVDLSTYARIPTGNGQAITYAPLPNGELPPNEVAIIFLGGFGCPAGIAAPSSAPAGAVHIKTSAPVVAYDIDPYGGGSSAITSATLLVPTSAWDTNYVAVAPWPFGNNSQPPRLTIIAAEDATDVTISPTVAINGGMLDGQAVPGTPMGVPATYTMMKGQALTFEQEAELTGSAILSTKPVGVIGSSGCINIDACCCDGAHQQIPPVRALGSEYVAVRYRNRVEGNEENAPWRMVGAVDGTTLTYEPAPPDGAPLTLSSGQIASFRSPGPFVVRSQGSDHPFYLAGYMTGGGDFNSIGDPEFVNVIPAQQYLSRYVFFADPTYPETNLVLVRSKAKDGTFKDVVLDCAGAIGGFQPLGLSGNYEFARFDLVRGNFEKQGNCDNGRREIHSEAPFGLTVWGWGTSASEPGFLSTYVSYAYPAGASVQQINEVVVPPVPK